MKKILFILFAALAFVACEKHPELITPFAPENVNYTPRKVTIDRATGGTVVISADVETYPKYIVSVDNDNGVTQLDTTILWKRYPNTYEVSKRRVYDVDGCKITLSEDFKQYTIEVEKDCEWEALQVETNKFDGARSAFSITLNP